MNIPRTYTWEIKRGNFFWTTKLVIEQDAPGADLSDTMAPVSATLHFLGVSMGYLYWALTLDGLRRKIAKHESREGFKGAEKVIR